MVASMYPRHILFQLSTTKLVKAWKFGMGFVGGLYWVQEYFRVLLEALGFFGGFRFLPLFNHTSHLNAVVPPWAHMMSIRLQG